MNITIIAPNPSKYINYECIKVECDCGNKIRIVTSATSTYVNQCSSCGAEIDARPFKRLLSDDTI